MNVHMGIDIGSLNCKGVIVRDEKIVANSVVLSGTNYRATAENMRNNLLQCANLSQTDITATVATGFGAGNVEFAQQTASDMICAVRGINAVFPDVRTVIDVASQTSNIMHVSNSGTVGDFAVNERCASGSGRFIEVIAHVLRVKLKDFGQLSMKSRKPVSFSTRCAVFGESEAITRVAEGVLPEDIAAGVNKALSDKLVSMLKRIGLETPCAICGGGALNIGLIKTLENALQIELRKPPEPQTIAALGAAIIAAASLISPGSS